MNKRVRLYKTVPVVFRGWIAFILALVVLGAFWYFCYWLIVKYAGGAVVYFKVGAWIAIILGLIMLIFNEPIVVFSMKCRSSD